MILLARESKDSPSYSKHSAYFDYSLIFHAHLMEILINDPFIIDLFDRLSYLLQLLDALLKYFKTYLQTYILLTNSQIFVYFNKISLDNWVFTFQPL